MTTSYIYNILPDSYATVPPGFERGMDFDSISGGLDVRLQELTETQLASSSPKTELDVSKESDDSSSTPYLTMLEKSLNTDSGRKVVTTRKWICCALSGDR